jgi:hypothetical protein
MFVGTDLTVSDDHVGVPPQDRRDELGDVGRVVLVVGVGVYDHVRAELQTGVQSSLETGGQPLVIGETHHVIHAAVLGHFNRLVRRAVIDDQPLHRVEPVELTGQQRQRVRQLLLLVETGNLDDQFHVS